MRIGTNAEFYDRVTAQFYMDLFTNGIKVEIFQDHNTQEVRDWCIKNCRDAYADSSDPVLITQEVYDRSMGIANGTIPNPVEIRDSNWMEARVSDMLARELQREIDRELLHQLGITIPLHHYWFASPVDAVLFKLTFGGE